MTTDLGRCIVTDCTAVPTNIVLGTFDDGVTWLQLTRPDGEFVRSCDAHLPEVLHRMTTFPGSPPRVAARSLYDAVHDDSPATTVPNRADRRSARGGQPPRQRRPAGPTRHRGH